MLLLVGGSHILYYYECCISVLVLYMSNECQIYCMLYLISLSYTIILLVINCGCYKLDRNSCCFKLLSASVKKFFELKSYVYFIC